VSHVKRQHVSQPHHLESVLALMAPAVTGYSSRGTFGIHLEFYCVSVEVQLPKYLAAFIKWHWPLSDRDILCHATLRFKTVTSRIHDSGSS